jgi:hypothetical protein
LGRSKRGYRVKLIANGLEFKAWVEEECLDEFDTVDTPIKYPLFARLDMKNGNYQTQKTVYLYAEDLNGMLTALQQAGG